MAFICPGALLDLEFERRASLCAPFLITPFSETGNGRQSAPEGRSPGQGNGRDEEY